MSTQPPGVAPQVQAIESARQYLGLTYREIAAAIHAEESTLHRWRKGVSSPTPVYLARLNAVDDLVKEVDRTFRDREHAREWLEKPNQGLQERSPKEVIMEGRLDRVTGMLYALNAGIFT